VSASQFTISGSNLVNSIIYNGSNFSFPGGFGQSVHGDPITVPLKNGTMVWRNMQFLYGTVEVRAKFTGVNTHPTIWMLSAPARQTAWLQNPNVTNGLFQNNENWVNEIDIAEGTPLAEGNTTTLRQNVFSPSGGQVLTTTVTDYSANFHVYKMTWTPSAITWFVDGVQTNQTTTGIPTGPMYLLIDIETDIYGAGAPSAGNFPQQMLIDYVKASDQGGTLFFYDEFDGTPAFQRFDLND
jgi:beta-glucanase (GH16 family)